MAGHESVQRWRGNWSDTTTTGSLYFYCTARKTPSITHSSSYSLQFTSLTYLLIYIHLRIRTYASIAPPPLHLTSLVISLPVRSISQSPRSPRPQSDSQFTIHNNSHEITSRQQRQRQNENKTRQGKQNKNKHRETGFLH